MTMKSLGVNSAAAEDLAAQALTDGTVQGSGSEMLDAQVALFTLYPDWTDGSHAITIQHRFAGGAWADADEAVVSATYTDANGIKHMIDLTGLSGVLTIAAATYDNLAVDFEYAGGKDEVRLQIVTTGSTTGMAIEQVLCRRFRLQGAGMHPMSPDFYA